MRYKREERSRYGCRNRWQEQRQEIKKDRRERGRGFGCRNKWQGFRGKVRGGSMPTFLVLKSRYISARGKQIHLTCRSVRGDGATQRSSQCPPCSSPNQVDLLWPIPSSPWPTTSHSDKLIPLSNSTNQLIFVWPTRDFEPTATPSHSSELLFLLIRHCLRLSSYLSLSHFTSPSSFPSCTPIPNKLRKWEQNQTIPVAK